MPLFLWEGRYTAEGHRGLLVDGGSKRRDVVQRIVEQTGGRLLSFHFALGEPDVLAIAEFPDAATAAALNFAVTASGSVTVRMRALLTPEEVDSATRKAVKYSPPGAR